MSENESNPVRAVNGRRFLRRLVWIFLAVLFAVIIALRACGLADVYYAPGFSLRTNFIASTLFALCAAYLVGRVFKIRRVGGLLLLVSGLVIWGLAGFAASVAGGGDVNRVVTIRSLCLWLSSVCELSGTVLIFRTAPPLSHPRWWVIGAWAVAAGVVMLIATGTGIGWTPLFFVNGEGGTVVRDIVLGSATAFLALSSALMGSADRRGDNSFTAWYGLGLATLAIGVFAAMITPSIGSPLMWVGWLTQCLGIAWVMTAAVLSERERGAWVATSPSLQKRQYRYLLAIAVVLVAAISRLAFLQALGTRMAYVTFYPAVMIAALYGGVAACLLATALSSCLVLFFWMEPLGQFTGKAGSEVVGMAIFIVSCIMISGITAAMRRAQTRSANAEAQAQFLAERQRAQEALAQSEQRFRCLFDNAMDPVFLTIPDGTISAANPAACAAFGMSEAELCQAGRAGIIFPDTRLTEALGERQRTGRTRGELTCVRKDGSRFPAQISSVIIGGEPSRAFVTVQDITERKRTEQALHENEERLRVWAREWQTTFDSVQSAIWLVDLNRKVLRCNRAAFRSFKLVVGERCCERMHGVPGPVANCPFDLMLQSRQRQSEVMDSGGGWMEVFVDPIFNEGGEVIGAVHVVNDITARKRWEDALRDSEERFHQLFEAESDAIVLVDFETHQFIEANAAALVLYGYKREELLGLHSVDVSGDPQETRRAINQGQRRTPLRWHRKKDGTLFPVEIAGNYFSYRGRRTHVAAIRDITERERTQAELLASRGQLRALAGRLQDVREQERTRIAREIHDVLAQDLTRLKIDLVWLHRRLTKPGETVVPAALAARVVEMRQLTDATISCVQKIATQLRPVALDTLGLCAAVEWQVREFQTRAPIQCQTNVPEQELPLDRDSATAFFRILQESLTNVLRHAKATRVDVHLRQEAQEAILTVSDNGCGIPSETLNNPMSIGLAGMRERALLLNGQFEIHSEIASGTTLEVRLPLSGKQTPQNA